MALGSVQATFDRLSHLPGVLAAILVDGQGMPVRTTMNAVDTRKYASSLRPLIAMARNLVREMDPADDLSYVRLRTRSQEMMVATENEHTIIVIQDSMALDNSRRSSIANKRRKLAS